MKFNRHLQLTAIYSLQRAFTNKLISSQCSPNRSFFLCHWIHTWTSKFVLILENTIETSLPLGSFSSCSTSPDLLLLPFMCSHCMLYILWLNCSYFILKLFLFYVKNHYFILKLFLYMSSTRDSEGGCYPCGFFGW